jgi:hypothetical protein
MLKALFHVSRNRAPDLTHTAHDDDKGKWTFAPQTGLFGVWRFDGKLTL